jgi:diguanylate cyclase (GGDEF)-like protein/PAS domain S-box-containing protein
VDSGSRNRLRAPFEQSSLAQAVTDLELRLTAVNRAMCELLGRTAEELVGLHVDDLTHPSGPPSHALELVRTGSLHEVEYERVYERPDGTPVPVRIFASRLTDDEGRAHGIASFVVDLSAQKQAESALGERERFFRALLERASDVAVVNAPDGTVMYANATVAQFGYSPEEVLGSGGFDFVHPEDRPAVLAAFAGVQEGPGSPVCLLYRHRHADGGFRWVESWISNKVDEPAIGGIVVNLRDVTARVEASHALRESEERYRAIVETAQEGIWVASPQGRTLYVNQKVADMTGRTCEELYDSRPTDLFDPDERPALLERLEDRGFREPGEYELRYPHPDGQQRWFRVTSSPLRDATGSHIGRLAMLSDNTEIKRIEATLRRRALYDELTGLANRTLLQDRLTQAAERCHGDATTVTVVALDVDGFALVNESLGHAAGDDLLVKIADRVRGSAGPGDTVARSGGDDFVVLTESVAADDRLEFAERILADLRQPFEVDGHQVRITVSGGVATSLDSEPTELVGAAGAAMHSAKRRGAGNLECFDARRAGQARARFELAADLVTALDQDLLDLHYQPIVELSTGRLLGVEALARWRHPVKGWIPPDVFVPAAEQSGLACQLDRWVLQRATADLARLRARKVVGDDVYVSINISALHLTQGDLQAAVEEAVWLSGLPAACVALEVTETAVIADPQEAADILRRIVAKGFSVSLDDFGTGYSSLTRLQTLPVARLKIDRGFVGNLVADADDLAICASVVDLCGALGVLAIAEGVETHEQLDLLQRLGCHAAQGYLWSRPLSLSDLSRVMSETGDHFDVAASARADTPARAWADRATHEHGLSLLLRLHREGASLRTIAAALNSGDYRTPRGTRWHPTSVAAVITDHAYPDLWKRPGR